MPSTYVQTASADAGVKHSFERCWTHFQSELTPDLDGVMATILTDEEAGDAPVFWIMPLEPDENGTVKIQLCPGWEGARAVYGGLFEQMDMRSAAMVLQYSSNWWCFHHAFLDFVPHGGEPTVMECAVVIRTDAEGEGITGEMAWLLDPNAPAAQHTAQDRFAIVHEYAAELGQGNFEAVLARMSDDVQGVVRDPVEDSAPILQIDGKEQMRASYQRLLESVTPVEVVPIQWSVVDPRYVLVDLYWTFEGDDGAQSHARTIEILPLNPAGKIVARIGWGSSLQPA